MVGTYSCYNCLNPIPANTLVCPYCGQVHAGIIT
jgi:RNA polymerase subunit RPABC4/transcription elongation factor Spt4